jgi:chromosome segregation ATPase
MAAADQDRNQSQPRAAQQAPTADQGPGSPSALDLLPEDVQVILGKEMELLDKCRTAECDLLKEEIEQEKNYRKRRTAAPASASLAGYSQEEIGRALDWLQTEKGRHEQQEADLNGQLSAVAEQVTAQEQKIQRLNEDIEELFKMLQALPAEVRRADDQVAQLKTALEAAQQRGFQPKVDLLQEELAAAEARQQRLKSQDTTLVSAIDQGLQSLREARDALRHLKVGGGQTDPASSLESLQIGIGQTQKQIEYLKQYQDVLIQRRLTAENQRAA